MILVIAAKHKFEKQKCFLISMAQVFSFSKLLQQSTHLQVLFSWDVMCKVIVPVMLSFCRNNLLQNDQSINKRS